MTNEAPATDVAPSGRRIGGGLVIVSACALLMALAALWWMPRTAQSAERVERDHGLSLPESARDIQAMGDMVRLVDHGRSAVFVIDATDLASFKDELHQVSDVPYSTFVPGNRQYQPSGTPWPSDSSPDESFSKASPAGGDFMHIEIYVIDSSMVGVWIYSDWN